MKQLTDKMTPDKVAAYGATPANWLCVNSKYFLFALRKLTLDGQETVFPGFKADAAPAVTDQLFHAQGRLPEISLAPGQSHTFTVAGYAGPKKYQRLQ